MAERVALRSIERRVRRLGSCDHMICDESYVNGLGRKVIAQHWAIPKAWAGVDLYIGIGAISEEAAAI